MKYLLNLINYIFIYFFFISSINSINIEFLKIDDSKNVWQLGDSKLNQIYESNAKKEDYIPNEEDEENIYLNGEYNNEMNLNKDNNNKRYIFHLNNSEYIYFFETDNIDGYIHYGEEIPCPNLCVIQYNQSNHENIIYINYYKNATEQNINIKISSIKNFDGEIKSIKSNDLKIDSIIPIISLKSILIFESYYDYILYLKSIDNSISIKCAVYTKEMSKSDILDINDKYFRNCHNRINELKSNTIYIISILSESFNKPVEILLQKKIINEDIEIIDDKTNFLFLSNETEKYTLDFSKNKIVRSIQLSRYTIESEISIEEVEANEEKKLNKDNLYFIFNDENIPFNGKLVIKITNGKSALINFLSKFEENATDILTEGEYTNYEIKKEITIIKFDNNKINKFIDINIFSGNNKEFKFSAISGYAKGNYFLNSSYNQISNLKSEYLLSELKIYNEKFTFEENEYFYLFIIFEKEKISDDSYQFFLNKTDKYSLDDVNVEISEEKCKKVIDSLIKLFNDGYIYTDIKKNPPNPEYFGAADIISDLNNIKIIDRKYYDFFRDIKRILGKIKDGHLNIAASLSPNGHNLQMMAMCLPFSFYIDEKSLEEAKIHITKFDTCFDFFSEEQKEFIEKYEGKYLKKINNTDPFDYIQNIQREFNSFYNKHSSFTYSISVAHQISIYGNPLSKTQLSNITFVFEDDESITLDYYLNNKQPQLINNKEFMEFYKKEILKQKKSLNAESILEIEKNFYKTKKNLKNFKNDSIEWKYSTLDGKGIQCRVDENNKLNVFKQTTFHFIDEEYKNALEVVENCTEEFYSNDYPIVGIESRNGGGVCKLSFYFQELLQVKILPTPHYSVKLSNLMKNYVEANISEIYGDPDMFQRIDIETCKPFSKFEDMKEIIDDYGNGVTHRRSQYFGIFNSTDLKKHKKRREKYFKMNKLKKPTDILIFTDSFSFSATSFFIKGLQETGSAILVGYFGNPKSNSIFDASQSPSFVGDFNTSDIYYNLEEAGFEMRGVTIYESFNYTYQEKNPIPREYLIHPVDERINIFKFYDDSLYDEFIKHAKDIFKKYNEDKECNPNNLDLLYDPNNKKDCYNFENDSHAHGGYECNPQTGNWSDICKPYYCDIGYYFDKYKNKCIKDICTEEDNENEDNGQKKVWAIIIAIFALIILLIICIIILSKCKSTKVRKTTGESGQLLSSRSSEVKEDN